MNPEDFIADIVNPVNTLKWSNILILNLNNAIVINEVVTLTYMQKYTAELEISWITTIIVCKFCG